MSNQAKLQKPSKNVQYSPKFSKRDDYENTLAALQKRYLPPDLDKNEDWSPHSDELVADFFDAKISDDEYLRVDGSLGQGTSKIGKSQSSIDISSISMQCLRQMAAFSNNGEGDGFVSELEAEILKSPGSNMQMLL